MIGRRRKAHLAVGVSGRHLTYVTLALDLGDKKV